RLRQALDLGVTHFDTAALYGFGANEKLVGDVLGKRPDHVIVASKCGLFGRDGKRVMDGRPEAIRATCEESLRNLRTDRIDLYYLHRWEKRLPIEESVGAMARLVERGLTRYIGLSEASDNSIQRARKVYPICSLQMEYSLWSRDPERGNIQACRDYNMGFMAYSPLGRGFFAGIVHGAKDLTEGDGRNGHPRFQPENLERNVRLLSQFEEIAKEKGVTPAQLALAWLMAQGKDIIPIPSNKTQAHLEENIKATEITLTPEDLARLDAIFRPEAVAGPRSRDMHRVNI
ncbi:MAG TPA: aldo/keto reductase, partial [Candidatus Binatia bacterium]